jgi:acyl dehydratase
LAALPAHAGTHLGSTAWRTVTQDQVDAFADLTEDHNPIHVDPGHAAGTPFGGTIVHGYFTVSLLAPLLEELLHVEGAALGVNYGIDKLRFPAPVPVGARFRASAELAEVSEIRGGLQIRVVATVEVESSPKPALVAECLFRYYA